MIIKIIEKIIKIIVDASSKIKKSTVGMHRASTWTGLGRSPQ